MEHESWNKSGSWLNWVHVPMLDQWWENKEITESNTCAHTPSQAWARHRAWHRTEQFRWKMISSTKTISTKEFVDFSLLVLLAFSKWTEIMTIYQMEKIIISSSSKRITWRKSRSFLLHEDWIYNCRLQLADAKLMFSVRINFILNWLEDFCRLYFSLRKRFLS